MSAYGETVGIKSVILRSQGIRFIHWNYAPLDRGLPRGEGTSQNRQHVFRRAAQGGFVALDDDGTLDGRRIGGKRCDQGLI